MTLSSTAPSVLAELKEVPGVRAIRFTGLSSRLLKNRFMG